MKSAGYLHRAGGGAALEPPGRGTAGGERAGARLPGQAVSRWRPSRDLRC